MQKTVTTRGASRLWALGIALALLGPWACGPRTAEVGVEAEPAAIQRTAGEFHLSLAGGLTGEQVGDAVCVFDSVGDELRVVMHPRGEGVCHYFILVVPGFAEEGDYRDRFGVTGVARSAGPAKVTVARSGPEMVLELTGEYLGAAGDGSVDGRATCPLPD